MKREWRQKKKIQEWNLKKKISVFMSLLILILALISLVVSSFFEIKYITGQTEEMAEEQLGTLASNYNSTLNSYTKLAIALTINSDVQNYCKGEGKSSKSALQDAVYSYMANMLHMENNMNFAVVMKDDGSYIYKGNSAMMEIGIFESYEEDYDSSVPVQEDSSVRMNYGRNYFLGNLRTLTLYYPIYSVSSAHGGQIGILMLNFKDNMLDQLDDSLNKGRQTFLTDSEGNVIFTQDCEKKEIEKFSRNNLKGKSGSFRENGNLVIYRRISQWNFYLVSQMPLWDVYKDSVQVSGILAVVITAITTLFIFAFRKIINSFYKPLGKVVQAMDYVAEGNLDNRIDMESMDADSRKLARGFNSMMDKIYELMEKIKLEQHQLEQIRFNALYAQIKPHFLYNTLDCIHWQAVADGNKKISVMVKALAQYYRSCLSKGKEIVSLAQELENIRSYLIIQNMRYGDIIQLEDQIEERFYQVQIPKMTLQPLIENAIYHGIRVEEKRTGQILLSVREEENKIYLSVSDDGVGIPEEEIEKINSAITEFDESFGYGVRNVNRRIVLLFGEDYGLQFRQNESGGTTVEICLPAGGAEQEAYYV